MCRFVTSLVARVAPKLVAAALLLLVPARGFAQRASDDYLPWNQAVDYQTALDKAASAAGMKLDPELVRLFGRVDAREVELMKWAREVDKKFDDLEARDRAVAAELKPLHAEKARLEREGADLQSERTRLDDQIRHNPKDPALQGRIANYNRRHADLRDRVADFNRRREIANGKLDALNKDWDAYDQEALQRYNPAVLKWQKQVGELRAMQQRERDRIVAELRRRTGPQSTTDVVVPLVKLSATKTAAMAVNTVVPAAALARTTQNVSTEVAAWAKKNPKELEAAGETIAATGVVILTQIAKPKVVVAVATAATVLKTSTAWAKAATEVETRKIKEEEDRACAWRKHMGELYEYRRQLVANGVAADEIGKRMRAKVAELRLGMNDSPQDHSVWANLIESSPTMLKVAIPALVGKALPKGPSAPATDADKRFLDKAGQRPADTTKLLRFE